MSPPIPDDLTEYEGFQSYSESIASAQEARRRFKKDDEELFGCESRYSALLAIAKELQFCADNMGLTAGSEDPEIVARARAASVRLNQLESFES